MILESPYFHDIAGGDYAHVVANAVDGPEIRRERLSAADVPWVTAALTFVGRTSEAEGIFSAHLDQLEPEARVAARFFLAVAHCREGRHERSRTLLAQNHRDAAPTSSELVRFFVHQGWAFYRYATGRLVSAGLWAERALRAATAAGMAYGCAIAHELLGHVQLSRGQVRAGFRSLKLAASRAEALGQGALLQAIKTSQTLYRATFGLAGSGEGQAAELLASLAACKFDDSYTRASLTIELARVRTLQGKLTDAHSLLESASDLVYQVDNPDLEIDHNLCVASLLRRRGDSFQALTLVRSCRYRARSREDIRMLLKVLGLEVQLLRELGRGDEQMTLIQEVESLTRRSGAWTGARMLARLDGQPAGRKPSRPGEDPLGDLIDEVFLRGVHAIPTVLRTGWHGLLSAALQIPPEARVLHLGLEPASLTIFDRGDVVHVQGGCSDLVRKLLLTLSAGESSKSNLAEALWGTRHYNPLRHDSLIYGLVAKTRKLLGPLGTWIEAGESGYRLGHEVRVLGINLGTVSNEERAASLDETPHFAGTTTGTTLPKPGTPTTLPTKTEMALMNFRQLAIVEWLRAGEVIDPRTVMTRLQISDATASRDLSGLVSLGMAARLGRGKATRYCTNGTTAFQKGAATT